MSLINYLAFKEISPYPYFRDDVARCKYYNEMTKRQSEMTINSFVNLKCIIHAPLTNTDQAKGITLKSSM